MPRPIKMRDRDLRQKLFLFTFLLFSSIYITSSSLADQNPSLTFLKKKSVLVLHSYSENFEWTQNIQDSIIKSLKDPNLEIDVYVEYLGTKRFPNRGYWQHLFNAFETKYQGTPIDLIITSDNNALDFLFKYRDRFYPNVPVVFCGINFFKPEMLKNQKKITGIAETTNLKETIDIALNQHPGTKKLIFIASSARSSTLNLKQLEKIKPVLDPALAIEVWKDNPIEEIEKMAGKLKKHSLVFIVGRTRNLKGEYISSRQMGRRVSSASAVPTYSLWHFYLGTGIVGGKLINGRDQGLAAAGLALKILKGIPVDDIPVITKTPTSYMFDYQQLKRFGINIKTLPNNSVVINKPYSFYGANKIIVWSTLIVIAILITLVIALSLNVLHRKKAERELQKHREDLEIRVEERTAELSEVNRALTSSEEKYRSLSDAAFEGIIITEKGIVLDVNETFCKMFGYDCSELVEMEATELATSDERAFLKDKIFSAYEKPYETMGLKKDGSHFPVEISAKMFEYKGRMVRVAAVRDISEKKRSEEEIKKLRGILPLCSYCKKVRDDEGYWEQVDVYIHKYSEADISHSICPECMKTHYPDVASLKTKK